MKAKNKTRPHGKMKKCGICDEKVIQIANCKTTAVFYYCLNCEALWIVHNNARPTMFYKISSRRFSIMGIPGDGGVGYAKQRE